MTHYFCFTVEPTPNHPLAGKIKGGWAHVFVRKAASDSELTARREVEEMHFLIHKLIHAREMYPEHLALLPEDIISGFRSHPGNPVYVEVIAYQAGENPEDLGDPFDDDFFNN